MIKIKQKQTKKLKELIQLALIHYQSGNLQAAEHICIGILRRVPNNFDALHLLGQIYYRTKKYDLAIKHFKKALLFNPFDPSAYNNCGLSIQETGQLEEAVPYYKKAIQLKSDFYAAYYNLGNTFKDNDQIDNAIDCYQKAIYFNPNYTRAYMNMGVTFKRKGQLDEAMSCFRKILQLDSNDAEAHWNMALVLLLSGNFLEGWKEYEWRWKADNFLSEQRKFPQPLWDGSKIIGRSILLYAEQGFGDTIQFIRYAPLVAQLGAKVIVECQKELAFMLRSVEGIKQVIAWGEKIPQFDVCCPLLSLPSLFNTTLETIPLKIPYMTIDFTLEEKWRNKVQNDKSKLKIGLAWSGRPTYVDNRFRSCSLNIFSPLAQLDDISFYTLQMGKASQEAKNPPNGMKLIDYTEDINDFSDTAAFIKNLDLVISVDTAVIHLAGALGKLVWTLLHFVPDWRWMLSRNDSPWYPTMRLFRQPSLGDWESVIAKVKDEIIKLLGKN